jgi:hypothetical protein
MRSARRGTLHGVVQTLWDRHPAVRLGARRKPIVPRAGGRLAFNQGERYGPGSREGSRNPAKGATRPR